MKKSFKNGTLALIVLFISLTILACSPAALPDDDFTESQSAAESKESLPGTLSETPEEPSTSSSTEPFSEPDAPAAETQTTGTTAEIIPQTADTTAETIPETTVETTLSPVPEPTAEAETVMETSEAFTMYAADSLNVRSGPGSEYDLLGTYQRNDRISVYDNSGQWASIDYSGTLAYVFSSYLSAAEIQEPVTEDSPATDPADDQRTGGNSNFNIYDNKDQQNTKDTYVLNTSSKKIHHPGCSSVPKIAPHNYATSSDSLAELEAQGYEKCKRCFK